MYKSKKHKKKKSIFKNRILSWLVLFLILVMGIFYLIFFSSFFQIKKIEILDSQKVSSQEIQNIIKEQIKKKIVFWETKSIFFQNFKETDRLLLEKFPVIEQIIFKRNFPDGLTIKIIEKKAIGEYCAADNCYSFDKNGVIFEPAEIAQDGLIISYRGLTSVTLGQKVLEKEILEMILKIQNKIENDLEIDIKEFVMEQGKLTVETSEGWEIYFPLEEINLRLTKLQLVLEKAIPAEKRKNLEYIDLRFTKAYYKYK